MTVDVDDVLVWWVQHTGYGRCEVVVVCVPCME